MADETGKWPSDTVRLDAMQTHGWSAGRSAHIPPRFVTGWFVGPLEGDGKMWGEGGTLREAIDDAIEALTAAASTGAADD